MGSHIVAISSLMVALFVNLLLLFVYIFWDELFIIPCYSLHAPEIAKTVLRYRYYRYCTVSLYHSLLTIASFRLNRARHLARISGYKGAMFPWQSASDGIFI